MHREEAINVVQIIITFPSSASAEKNTLWCGERGFSKSQSTTVSITSDGTPG